MKRGGSRMGYTEQFNLLSPCYKDGEQPAGFHMGGTKAKPTKKGKSTKKGTKATKKTKSKQKGGSSCYASPSVSEMGVYDKPASLEQTASELAWDNRMKGGEPNANGLNSLNLGQPVNTSSLLNLDQPANTSSSLNLGKTANGSNTTKTANGNNSTKTNQVNNVSTYLNKLKDVVFDKDTTGFAIVVERTTENPLNSKQDKYKIKVIETKDNTPLITVLTEKTFSDILNIIKSKPFEVFPKKNNKSMTQTNSKPSTNNIAKIKNSIGAVNYSIQNNNTVSKNVTTNAKVNATVNAKVNGNAKVKVNANANSIFS
jgi:hypothetical protein